MPITLEKLKEKLEKIKKLGFVKTVRAHDGGVGNTLEFLLGIKENNISLPDIGDIEIKAKRIDSSSMLTLVSKSPLPIGVNKNLFNSYSHVAEDGIRKLYTTIYGSRINPQNFRVVFEENKLVLKNKNNIPAYWPVDLLFLGLKAKAEKVLLVYAETKGKKGSVDEMFHYTEAYLLSGLEPDRIKKVLENGKLKFDIRIGADKAGKKIGIYHDHGTAIRISKQDYLELYKNHYKII